MKQGGPQRGQNAEDDGNGNRSQVHEQDAGWIDEGWNAIEVINVSGKNVLTRDTSQELFDFIDVLRDPQAQSGAKHGPHDSEQEPVAQKDLHDASVGGAQGL